MTELTRNSLVVTAGSAPAPRQGGPTDPSHDERLRRGILETDVSRPVAAVLVALFLFLIYAIPIGEAVIEKLDDEESVLLGLFQHVPTAERLRQFEEELEQASRAKEFVQPRVQLLLTRLARAGNEKAVVGRRGWLYYEPGVRHLYGPGFLARDSISAREKAALDAGEAALHADPRPAILDFHRALSRRNIRLILFPVPDKATLQPVELHGRSSPGDPIARNVDWRRFVADLSHAGVLVFDPLRGHPVVDERARYMVQDTHWTPAFMQEVASELAAFVERTGALPSADPKRSFARKPERIARVGDIVDMLKLPAEQAHFLPQTVTVFPVHDENDALWDADPEAKVLLLGDSFTNIFSMQFMGWGEAAGLAPQLSFALGRGVDVIAQNDSGAFATREALARELAQGSDRLAGKRVVIWEFAARELSVGNWKPVDWNSAMRGSAQQP